MWANLSSSQDWDGWNMQKMVATRNPRPINNSITVTILAQSCVIPPYIIGERELVVYRTATIFLCIVRRAHIIHMRMRGNYVKRLRDRHVDVIANGQ